LNSPSRRKRRGSWRRMPLFLPTAALMRVAFYRPLPRAANELYRESSSALGPINSDCRLGGERHLSGTGRQPISLSTACHRSTNPPKCLVVGNASNSGKTAAFYSFSRNRSVLVTPSLLDDARSPRTG
jgi:hypothetical protein